MLRDLEGRDAEEDQFDHLVAKLKLEVTARVRDEEGRLFPLLAAACTLESLDALGEKVRKAKKTASTRPHPSAPHTPPGNKIIDSGAGMVTEYAICSPTAAADP